MKKYLFFMLVAWVLTGCGGGYTIDGITDKRDGVVLLTVPHAVSGVDTLCRSEIENGKFHLKGHIEEPVCAFLQIGGRSSSRPLFLENASFTVSLVGGDVEVTDGGVLQHTFRQIEEEEKRLKSGRDSLKARYRKFNEQNDLFGVMHIRAEMMTLDSLIDARENDFIQANDNLVGAWLIRRKMLELARQGKLAEKYALLGSIAGNTVWGKEIAACCLSGKGTVKGNIAPDFTMNTPEGEALALHSLPGKVKIIDFWASWCGPCRAGNPELRRLYGKYHDQGLEIIGVSLDSKKEPWVQAIQQDGLDWIHVSDLKGWENAAAKKYGIKSIPHVIVLDSNNRIVAEKLYGVELENCVAEILKK